MSRPAANRAEAARFRSLDSIFRVNGHAATLRLSGTQLTNQTVLMGVHEIEEDIQGSQIEAAMKGFRMRLRLHHLPDGLRPTLGDTVELVHPFEGHRHFHIDGAGRSFNRSGLQIIVSLSVADDPARRGSARPAGYDFD